VLTFFSRESFNGHTTLRNDIVTQLRPRGID
jgi:hypothetical protein